MKFAFLVHPRDLKDVYKKYPLLQFFPERMVNYFLLKFWPPVYVAKITGLKSKKENIDIEGCVISIPITAKQMIENRQAALEKIIAAVKFAKKKGIKIIGLGGMISSLSKGGLDLLDKTDINITTGHAYTAYNVTKNLFKLSELFGFNKKEVKIAIVGAAGSIGSTSALILAREGYQNFVLIDLERKHHFFKTLTVEMKKLNSGCNIELSHKINDTIKADFVITATNAPEALVKSEDLKIGAIVIDDAQPSDISEDVFDRKDVLVVSAGVVHTPNIETHFDFGLADNFDNFCCLAELLILSAHKWDNHYVINRATIKDVDEIGEWGDGLGFTLGHFQNPKGLLREEDLFAFQKNF